jgi:NAD(P)-dependent dehydrogenase (short-subunit alcohol dehydrogenase family)
MEDLFSLEGRVALITGASRGIGEAIAVAFAQKGAHCILASRKLEDLESVVVAIEKDGGRAKAVACNVGDMGQIDSLAAMMKKEHGKLDILVNNAATNPYFGNMDGIDLPRWDKTFDVNLKGPFFLIQKTIDLLAASGKGSVINVSSISGKRPGPFQGVYSITKAAMISMTQGFAKELGLKSIRVNALLPGMTKTRFSAALMENEELLKAVYKMIPLGRHALPDEMAGAALYLASDASSYTTGTCLTCDGGFLA